MEGLICVFLPSWQGGDLSDLGEKSGGFLVGNIYGAGRIQNTNTRAAFEVCGLGIRRVKVQTLIFDCGKFSILLHGGERQLGFSRLKQFSHNCHY